MAFPLGFLWRFKGDFEKGYGFEPVDPFLFVLPDNVEVIGLAYSTEGIKNRLTELIQSDYVGTLT